MAETEQQDLSVSRAYDAGRRAGLAISALALSLVGFLSLLGAEKAILAIVLGVLAVRGGQGRTAATRMGLVAVTLGVVWLVSMAVLLIVFWPKVMELAELLQRLS
jgi:hypothetical protein